MSGTAWALVAISAFWAILVGFLCYVLVNLFRVLTSTRDLLEDVRGQTTPLLAELNETVSGLNRELGEVDEILVSVRGTTTAVEGIARTVQATVAHPAIRALAIAAGAGRAYQRFRGEES